MTVFSASNYCGTMGNYGGVVVFKNGENPTVKVQSGLV